MLAKSELKAIKFRKLLRQTESQKKLFHQLNQICTTQRGLWQKFADDADVDDLFLIVKFADDGYGLTQDEEGRLKAAINEHVGANSNRVNAAVPGHKGPAPPISLPTVEDREPPPQYQARTMEFEDSKDIDTAGEHTCLRSIIKAIRLLSRQVQPVRWRMMVDYSGTGMRPSEWGPGGSTFMHQDTLRNLHSMASVMTSDEETADSEKESVPLVIANMRRQPAAQRVEKWRIMRQMAKEPE